MRMTGTGKAIGSLPKDAMTGTGKAIGSLPKDATSALGLTRASVHGRPRFAKWSVRSGLKVRIASVHPDFDCGLAAVPDGMSWLVPDRFDALEVPQTHWV
jgi:hypothetical protein